MTRAAQKDNLRHSKFKKHKSVIVLKDASSLSHLPKAAPLTIDELLESIDRLTYKRFDALSCELSTAIKAQILHSNISFDELSLSSGCSIHDIFSLQQQQLIPDLEKLAAICKALGGKLELQLENRNGVMLDCSQYIHNSKSLELHLHEHISSLALHSLASAVWSRFGLQPVSEIDGGTLEKTHPFLFRLMRIAAFMRCKMTLNAVFA